jgi:hypothetical protein
VEDYDYWMRLNAVFRVVHASTPEPLYRYRWHANSLTARARELRIAARVRALMARETRRGRWRARPWRVRVDPELAVPLLRDGRGSPLDGGPKRSDRSPDDKELVIVGARRWIDEGVTAAGGRFVVVCWHREAALAAASGTHVRAEGALHVAFDDATAAALDLWTPRVVRWRAERAEELVAFASACGDDLIAERRCAEGGRAGGAAGDRLPEPWIAPERRLRLRIAPAGAELGLAERIAERARACGLTPVVGSAADGGGTDRGSGAACELAGGIAAVAAGAGPERREALVLPGAAGLGALGTDPATLARVVIASGGEFADQIVRVAAWLAQGGSPAGARGFAPWGGTAGD